MEACAEAQLVSPTISKWIQNLILGLVVVGAIGFAFLQEARKGMEMKVLLPALLLVAGILGFWLFIFKLVGLGKPTKGNPKSWKKWYRKQTGRDESKVVCEFGEVGMLITTEGGVATHHPWQAVPRVVERPAGLLVYIGPQIFHWFPRTVFASLADYDALLNLVRKKVAKPERNDAKA
jgi:hypothetical protein